MMAGSWHGMASGWMMLMPLLGIALIVLVVWSVVSLVQPSERRPERADLNSDQR